MAPFILSSLLILVAVLLFRFSKGVSLSVCMFVVGGALMRSNIYIPLACLAGGYIGLTVITNRLPGHLGRDIRARNIVADVAALLVIVLVVALIFILKKHGG